MGKMQHLWSCKGRILQCLIMVFVWETASAQIYYSIPEEMRRGSFVGNIAKDLGMDGRQLSNHGLRIVPSIGRSQYFAFNVNSGHLQTSERMDREEICGEAEKCILKFQLIIESKLELFGVEVEITDINDNSPQFLPSEWKLKISETAILGDRLLLPKAEDLDLGINAIQTYQLEGSSHFSLDVQMEKNGITRAELVLAKTLDREEQPLHDLILTATDGGDPVRSGTAQIQVIVLDANDNAPHFSQPIYEADVMENIPTGSTVCTVGATDPDEGINREINYSFQKITEKNSNVFLLNPTTGDIILKESLDYEVSSIYQFEVQATDGGGLSDVSKIVVSVIDLNDNSPELAVTFMLNSVPENAPVGTVVAILNVQDRDSGVNGEIKCSIPDNFPFQLKRSIDNFYSIVTHRALDREQVPAYNVTVTAMDLGTPPLLTSTTISLQVLDTNDNPPLFAGSSYTSSVFENNPRGALMFSLKANDPDWEENARVTYSILEEGTKSPHIASYLSINSESGAVYALNSFDYEEFRKIHFMVKAQDGGSPPLSSNVSVTLLILDQNDNAPQILHPSPPTDGSTGIELAPRSSEPGYLVTKVVAVDADSGQNGWLSYQLLKATEPGLFTIGLHTGKIRTARLFLEKDALRQSLVVSVKDNGQPPLSASVTVTVVLADSIPDVLTDLSSISAPADAQSDLSFFLVVAVASVSCLFFAFLLVMLALRLRRWRNSQLCAAGSMTFSGVPVSQFVGIDGVQAFLHSYCQEVSLTADSRKSQLNFSKTDNADTMANQLTGSIKDPVLVAEDLNLNNGDLIVVQVS